jgi:hypothetical protein
LRPLMVVVRRVRGGVERPRIGQHRSAHLSAASARYLSCSELMSLLPLPRLFGVMPKDRPEEGGKKPRFSRYSRSAACVSAVSGKGKS